MDGALADGRFRRLLAGRAVTNFGDSIYMIAAMWLVYELTGNPFYTGVAGFLTLAPSAFQFLAGPLADKWRIRRTLVATQLIQALLVVLVPVAQVLDVLTVWLVLIVMPAIASLNQLANPTMVAALPRLLDDEDLVEGNSALAIANQGIDMIGYGLGGLFVGALGAIGVFLLDAVTFSLAAALFATVAVPSTTPDSDTADSSLADPSRNAARSEDVSVDGGAIPDADDEPYLRRLRSGFSYVYGTVMTWLIVGAAAVNFTAGIAIAVMPVYADSLVIPSVLGAIGGAGAYGILMGSFAAGNLLGAAGANLVDDRPLGGLLIIGLATGGVLWMGAIAVDWLPITALLLMGAFIPVGMVNVHVAALVQSAPPEDLVGRVSSVLGSATAVTIPIGSLIGGTAAGLVGPRTAMFVVGGGMLLLAVYVLLHPELRALPQVDQVEIQN